MNAIIRYALAFQLCMVFTTANTVSDTAKKTSEEEVTCCVHSDSEASITNEAIPDIATDAPKAVDVTEVIPFIQRELKKRDLIARLPQNESLADFDGGSYLFINASDTKLLCEIGERTFELASGEGRLLQSAFTQTDKPYQVTLSYQLDDTTWKVYKDTRWTTTKSYRSLIYFHKDPDNGRLKMVPMVDILPYAQPNNE
jgi:hypothetical protein